MAEISIQTSEMDFIVSCTDAEAKHILKQVVEQFTQWRPPHQGGQLGCKARQIKEG